MMVKWRRASGGLYIECLWSLRGKILQQRHTGQNVRQLKTTCLKNSIAEMRMMKWMHGNTLRHRIRNGSICKELEVTLNRESLEIVGARVTVNRFH